MVALKGEKKKKPKTKHLQNPTLFEHARDLKPKKTFQPSVEYPCTGSISLPPPSQVS